MRFAEFVKLSEEQSGTDHGLMGYPVASSVRKPSDGQPFKQYLGCISGQTPRGAQGGAPASPFASMMRKRMRKR